MLSFPFHTNNENCANASSSISQGLMNKHRTGGSKQTVGVNKITLPLSLQQHSNVGSNHTTCCVMHLFFCDIFLSVSPITPFHTNTHLYQHTCTYARTCRKRRVHTHHMQRLLQLYIKTKVSNRNCVFCVFTKQNKLIPLVFVIVNSFHKSIFFLNLSCKLQLIDEPV